MTSHLLWKVFKRWLQVAIFSTFLQVAIELLSFILLQEESVAFIMEPPWNPPVTIQHL